MPAALGSIRIFHRELGPYGSGLVGREDRVNGHRLAVLVHNLYGFSLGDGDDLPLDGEAGEYLYERAPRPPLRLPRRESAGAVGPPGDGRRVLTGQYTFRGLADEGDLAGIVGQYLAGAVGVVDDAEAERGLTSPGPAAGEDGTAASSSCAVAHALTLGAGDLGSDNEAEAEGGLVPLGVEALSVEEADGPADDASGLGILALD